MTREELIEKGKIWVVTEYENRKGDGPGVVAFEGNKTGCLRFVKEKKWNRRVKIGEVRLGQVLWENLS